jgi:hypothetical protein
MANPFIRRRRNAMQISHRLLKQTTRAGARLFAAAAIALTMSASRQASAASPPTASGTITTAIGSPNTYTLTINNFGSSSTIGSVWSAWVPGGFYMTSSPTLISTPSGWTDDIMAGAGGYSIQWLASSPANYIPIGGSLSGFVFQSSDPNINGTSTVAGDAGIPTMRSVAYDAGLFSDGGTTFAFTPVAVPEPTTLAVLAPTALLMLRRSRSRRA